MIENQVKVAVCVIDCGAVQGTGFLISENLVLTARHCVIDAIEGATKISLNFPERDTRLAGKILDDSPELDVCLISLSKSINIEPIPLDCGLLPEGLAWYSLGFPSVKRSIGHRAHGNVSQVLNTPKRNIDLDLEINTGAKLSDFRGMSGSALICGGVCKGVICLKLDGSLGSISTYAIKGFLEKNDIHTLIKIPKSKELLADRSSFEHDFEQKLSECLGKYIFLEGKSGLGKTTFCKNFDSNEDSLINLGCYSFSDRVNGLGIQHRAQPKIFFEWLSAVVSKQLTGNQARIEDKPYDLIISETQSLLSEFSQYCSTRNSKGVLFVDGLNEVQETSEQLYSSFIGLLPQTLPESIIIVLTAPNYEVLASKLDGRIQENCIVSLPKLEDEAACSYCWQRLGERANSRLINNICEKAGGHPLYLRYLIEFVNNSEDHDSLNVESFPLFSGSVSEYYEHLWAHLFNDADATALLAIFCRLRYGIKLDFLTQILSESERSAFITTYSKIRHLLSNSTDTTIYHFSFTEFLKQKTALLNKDIEERLASFCINNKEVEYCAINCVYHSLLAGEGYRNKAIELCTQSWVDSCVNFGIAQDSLLFDIEEVLEVVTTFGKSVESIRILLLSQRVNFRYNTLFHQSARLIAEALISLGKPEEAIQHCIRYNTLLIEADEVIEVSTLLLQKDFKEEAKKLLCALQEQIDLLFESIGSTDEQMTLDDFVLISQYKVRCLLLLSYAEEDKNRSHIVKFLKASISLIQKIIPSSDGKVFLTHASFLQAVIPGFSLRFDNEYLGMERLKRNGYPTNIPNLYELFISSLYEALDWLDPKVINSSQYITEIFKDLEEALNRKLYLSENFVHHTCDSLITLGAHLSLVQRAAPPKYIPSKIISIEDNGVDICHETFDNEIKNRRIFSFLSEEFDPPEIIEATETEWLKFLESISEALVCCDGAARRAKATNDIASLEQIHEYIELTLLKALNFSLKDRVSWQDSYSIPESVLPLVYNQLSKFYIDCFPQQIQTFLGYLSNRLDAQFGLYSEGFRELLFESLNLIISKFDLSSIEDDVFDLLDGWKTYVINNLENRHELVPELLRLIPLFVKVDAKEVSDQLYQRMLQVSMGPSWYKEDQFGLMVSFSKNSKNLPAELRPILFSQIAGYLERASGEMTFQRFVRYEKAFLIGELCRIGSVSQAIKYFRRQSCGTLTELYSEATRGSIDRVGELTGMRYPGGALDEQDSILQIVKNTPMSDWRLRWGLLEIYLFGDKRHVSDFAKEFAILINSQNGNNDAVIEMATRLNLVILTELSKALRSEFIDHLQVKLDKRLHHHFQNLFELFPKKTAETFSSKTENDFSDTHEPLMPGTFGSGFSIKTSKDLLAQSQSKLKRGNVKEARDLAVDGLRALQEGGWSIWGNLSGESSCLKEIINGEELDADEITHLYSPIILKEHHQPRWRLAESLLQEFGDKLDKRDCLVLSEYVVDHVKYIVGDATKEIEDFKFLGEDNISDSNIALIEFIVWLVDHPDWVRKEHASEVLAWLLDKTHVYIRFFVEQAFSINEGFGSDVICGVLDGMSLQNPIDLWNKIDAYIDEGVVDNVCKHTSRLVILHRIARRAVDNGEKNASVIISKIESFWNERKEGNPLEEKNCINTEWIKCIEKEWRLLRSISVLPKQVCESFEFELNKLCLPLNIQKAMALESLVLDSFREGKKSPFSRWEAKVRFALNLALSKYISKSDSYKVERLLRIHNPYMPILSNKPLLSKADQILQAIQGDTNFENVIYSDSTILIHYHEMIYIESHRKWIQVEISSVLISAYSAFKTYQVGEDSLFSSTDFIETKKNIPGYETCFRIKPKFSFLGVFSPAEPSSKFLKLLNIDTNDIIKKSWQGERTSTRRPTREGCSLSVNNNHRRLPPGFGLSWSISIDGERPQTIGSKRF